ncbi:MAG TPA: RNA polymerase subunit sigma-70 [Parvularcula sp.]|nr:RNA polymerase subunit sigma-70 [Parvularcula sp.]HBS35870.1 RNA polymerase subunit sigma-70 [Parvularcula sp.]
MAKDAEVLRREILDALQPVRRFAYALTGTRADADDLLQATVVRLLERGVPDDADTRKWAFRVCKNMWIDEVRARKVRRDAAASADLQPEADLDGERTAMGAVALAEAERAIAKLPEDQRAALALVAIEGLSYAEAAEALDTPIGTIMSRISRARAALANALPAGLQPAAGA